MSERLGAIGLKGLFYKNKSHKKYSRKQQPKVRSESGRKTFAFYGANIFNSLPNDMKTETSILHYKTKFNLIDLNV
jgi:uncharacterized membrane protein required for colicin V production